ATWEKSKIRKRRKVALLPLPALLRAALFDRGRCPCYPSEGVRDRRINRHAFGVRKPIFCIPDPFCDGRKKCRCLASTGHGPCYKSAGITRRVCKIVVSRISTSLSL